MGKVVDITDKLSFDGNPSLLINGVEVEVNADAPTVLKVMNYSQQEMDDVERINEMYKLIFPEESQKKINDFKPSISDWMTIVQEAMGLVTGDIGSQGEH